MCRGQAPFVGRLPHCGGLRVGPARHARIASGAAATLQGRPEPTCAMGADRCPRKGLILLTGWPTNICGARSGIARLSVPANTAGPFVTRSLHLECALCRGVTDDGIVGTDAACPLMPLQTSHWHIAMPTVAGIRLRETGKAPLVGSDSTAESRCATQTTGTERARPVGKSRNQPDGIRCCPEPPPTGGPACLAPDTRVPPP